MHPGDRFRLAMVLPRSLSRRVPRTQPPTVQNAAQGEMPYANLVVSSCYPEPDSCFPSPKPPPFAARDHRSGICRAHVAYWPKADVVGMSVSPPEGHKLIPPLVNRRI